MAKKSILLTGDDGYNSVGTRLLIYFLKNKFKLTVAGTLKQQSGVGGLVHVYSGGKYGESEVDGVPAFWVEGSPADAMECARSKFKKPFDLVISGINLGVNIGANVISSGTFSAAYRGFSLGLAKNTIAISWDVHYRHFYKYHNGIDDLEEYLKYPGEISASLIEEAIRNKFWNAKLLNINLPQKPTRKVKFARLLMQTFNYWPPAKIDKKNGKFYFPEGNQTNHTKDDVDSTVIDQGMISVTPIDPSMLDSLTYKKLQTKLITLK